ncbi:uncharacterized protein B0H18DRAFT_668451 [Fomitopsis serialis]|uniref:uncharacterized protein n=1 Tax=Fomitopsis serialis TaxID=139415 RepID=UPI0020074C67|nr:uncharacterized protein B0H18DRAFT_668451 [Neoantrodia serialis]KAH9918451.1 hypothetical protein B0H18DRAFT_668451 [Neoantrodia serialis]
MSLQGVGAILPEGATPTSAWMLLNVLTTLADGRTVFMESYVTITLGANYTFTLSPQSGVAPYAWVDHPSGTVGYFIDTTTGAPLLRPRDLSDCRTVVAYSTRLARSPDVVSLPLHEQCCWFPRDFHTRATLIQMRAPWRRLGQGPAYLNALHGGARGMRRLCRSAVRGTTRWADRANSSYEVSINHSRVKCRC